MPAEHADDEGPGGPWGGGSAVARRISISPTAVLLLAVWIGLGAAMGLLADPPQALTFLFVIAGWLLSVIAHEFGHAFVAWRGGDYTVPGKGYLTLDPLKYANLLTSLILPLLILAIGGIGFPGGAVYLRQDLIKNRLWRAAASLAGPAGTLAALVFLALAYALANRFAADGPLAPALALLVFLQATALILNLMPVPGLDGYGVIRPFLPRVVRSALLGFERIAIVLFLGVLLFVPGVSEQLIVAARDLTLLAGVSPLAAIDGLRAFQFWQ